MLIGVTSINGKSYSMLSKNLWFGVIFVEYHEGHPCTPLAHVQCLSLEGALGLPRGLHPEIVDHFLRLWVSGLTHPTSNSLN